MTNPPDDDVRWLGSQIRPEVHRGPQPIAEVLSRLMAGRGYAHVQSAAQWLGVWQQAAGELAGRTRPGKFTRGVLEIVVENSAALQELTFQKKKLLSKMNQLAPQSKLRELRFKVGEVT